MWSPLVLSIEGLRVAYGHAEALRSVDLEAKGGEILTSQRVFAAVKGRFVAEPRGELSLKGFSKPVPAYKLANAA